MVLKRFLTVLAAAVMLFHPSGVHGECRRDSGHDRNMERVRELFRNDMYSAARDEIIGIYGRGTGLSVPERSELASYSIICNIKLGAPDLDALMDEYTALYRYSPEYMGVLLLYAGYYFEAGNFTRALEILDTVDYSLLCKKDRDRYVFQRSYCQLNSGRIGEAEQGFGQLAKGAKDKYTVPSVYYSGYIAYINRDFRKAVELFSKIRNDGHFGPMCSYCILESELMLGNYDYVVKHGPDVLEAVSGDIRPKVARIMSQAYYSLDKPEEARKWFEDYSSSGADMTRQDNYYLGIISYSLQSYNAAVEAFAKVVNVDDSLSQSACMHMANSYLKLKNKHEAMKYYRKASEMVYNGSVREESYFNYAKLAFDMNSDITVFQDYLSIWPETERSDEIYSYIATSCLLAKKYKSAINALNKIHVLTPEMDVNLQKAAFLRGLELFGRGSYGGADTDFRIALKHSTYNRTLKLLTQFWLAETCYRAGRTDEAIAINGELDKSTAFRSFKEYPLMIFGQAYCYFSKGDYGTAVAWFRRFIDQHGQDMDLIIEARLRIGDALFAMKEYAMAASAYEEVSMINYQLGTVVYAAYQCAVSYGLVHNMEKKISILEGIMDRKEDTPMYSKAVYELGRAYVQEGLSEKAEKCFKYLLDDVRDPQYTAKSMLELGMLYSNSGEYERALEYLTGIVEGMPLSEDTENALAVMESIYAMLNKPEEYLAYLDRIGMSGLKTQDEKELMIFNAAERTYLSGNYHDAEKSLRSFVEEYPDGAKTPLAYFYLGESLSALGRKEEAARAYLEVMDKGEGAFVELSTLHYARICYEMEKYDLAASAYESLYGIARLDNNRTEAQFGIMRSYFMNEKYNSALDAASELAADHTLSGEDSVEVQYVTAKSLMALGRRTEALPVLKKLSAKVFTPQGAEAAYMLIQDTYDAGQFEEVENLVYAFSDSQTDQTYWLAKSFIVLGDSFAEREEWEQARATFGSIRDGYSPRDSKDDVLEQVNVRIEKLDKIMAE